MPKKESNRFCIKFGDSPDHQLAAELLNAKGHKKAQFITDAVLHYIRCTETVINRDEDMLYHRLELMIRSAVRDALDEKLANLRLSSKAEQIEPRTVVAAENKKSEMKELDHEGKDALKHMMGLFKK